MIEKMKFLRITGPKEDISRVIRTYLTKYELHVENAMSELCDVNDIIPFVDTVNVRESITKSQDTIEQLRKETNQDSNKQTITDVNGAVESLARMHLLLDDLEVQKKTREDQIAVLQEQKDQLMPFLQITVPLGEMNQYKFIKYQFGRISIDNYDKMMKFVYSDMNTLFMECTTLNGFVYGAYFVPSVSASKEDAVFSTLHFEDITFPKEYTATSKEICYGLDQKILTLRKEIDDYTTQMLDVTKKHAQNFIESYDFLKEYVEDGEIRKMAACTKQEQEVYYILCGWMSEKETKLFREEIKQDDAVECFVDDTNTATTSKPPTKLKNPKIFKPFEMFIKMYGLPAYGELDPTIFLAMTYSFLFGMMYGDAGQGLCLVIGGFILYKVKKQNLCAIISCAGVSSTIFGFLYGSVFGFEDILHPIWVNPMKDTMTVLFTAIVFGVSLILISMVLNIINGIREKNIQKIFFDTNGVAGLVFYGTLIGVAALLFTGHTIKGTALIVVMLVVPLVLIFLREPITRAIEKKKNLIPGPKGMFFVENGFEMFEVLLSYLTNTISFVRVGAFALCHAGMMSVVLLLAHASTGHPNVAVLVLGNLFVAGLEGLIVGIQVLRLEYYEMFGRFYSGTGKEFKSRKMKEN